MDNPWWSSPLNTASSNNSSNNLFCGACLVVALVLGSGATRAQQPTRQVRYRLSNQTTKRDIGSARRLEGVVYAYHVFVSDLYSSWTDEEKTKVKQKIYKANDFISWQARMHNKSVTFVNDFAPSVRLADRIPQNAHADPRWTEMAIRQAAGTSSVKLVQSLRKQSRSDNIIICLHVDKEALSYNLAFYENVSEKYSAERMICFSAYPDGRETSAATYAHEILHLFGAGDLYFPYDDDDQRKRRAGTLFPNDVMYRVDYNIRKLNVGVFTAYRVGWSDSLDRAYADFED